MSVVHLHVQTPNGSRALVGVMDEQIICAHSKTVRQATAAMSPALIKDVFITGAAPAAVRFLVTAILGLKRKEELHLRVRELPLVRCIAVYEALEALRIEPAQPHVERHVIGYTSHCPITAEEMVATHKVFYSREGSKAWTVMVHQVAWMIANGKVTEAYEHSIVAACQPFPELLEAIDRKGQALAANHDAQRRQQAIDNARALQDGTKAGR